MDAAADSADLGIAVDLQEVSHTFKSRAVFEPISLQLQAGSECLIREPMEAANPRWGESRQGS